MNGHVEDDDDMPTLDPVPQHSNLHNDSSIGDWLEALDLLHYESKLTEFYPNFETVEHLSDVLSYKNKEYDFNNVMNSIDVTPNDREVMETSLDAIEFHFMDAKAQFVQKYIQDKRSPTVLNQEKEMLIQKNEELTQMIERIKQQSNLQKQNQIDEQQKLQEQQQIEKEKEKQKLDNKNEHARKQQEQNKQQIDDLHNELGSIESQRKEEVKKLRKVQKELKERKERELPDKLEDALDQIGLDPQKFTRLFYKCGIKTIKDVENLNVSALKQLLDYLMGEDLSRDERTQIFSTWKSAQRSSELLHWFASLGKLEGDCVHYDNSLYLLGVRSVSDLGSDKFDLEEFFQLATVSKNDQELFLRCRPQGMMTWLENQISNKGGYPKKYAKLFSKKYECENTADLVRLYATGHLAKILKDEAELGTIKGGHRLAIRKGVQQMVPRRDGASIPPRGPMHPPKPSKDAQNPSEPSKAAPIQNIREFFMFVRECGLSGDHCKTYQDGLQNLGITGDDKIDLLARLDDIHLNNYFDAAGIVDADHKRLLVECCQKIREK